MEQEVESNININFKSDIKDKQKTLFSFLKISNWFSKFETTITPTVVKNSSNEITSITKEEQERKDLETKVDQFFEIKNYELILAMIKNGYILTTIQKEQISNQMKLDLENKNMFEVEKFLELGLDLPLSAKTDFFKKVLLKEVSYYHLLNMRFFMLTDKIIKVSRIEDNDLLKTITSNEDDGDEDIGQKTNERINYLLPILTKQLRDFIKDPNVNYCTALFNHLIKDIVNHQDDKKLKKETYKYLSKNPVTDLIQILSSNNKDYFLKNITFDELFNSVFKVSKSIGNDYSGDKEKLVKQLNKILSEDFKDGFNAILQKTKNVYNEEYINTITVEKIAESTKELQVNNLPIPLNAKNIVKEIHHLYQKIEDCEDEIAVDEKLVLQNLFEVRIPEILKKYLVLDDEFKTTFKNLQNQNAEEVMINSLNEFKEKFEQIWKEVNEQRFSSLNASGKYAKSINSI